MNEILKVSYNNERITLSARELHEFLEVGSNYTTWFNRMCEYGFKESIDFQIRFPKMESESRGGQNKVDHEITLDMAKEIAMIQRNEKGKQARQYFIEVEKQWNSPERIIARGLIESQKMIENLNQQVIEMKPKALFADAVATAENSCLVGELAKMIKANGYDIGQKRLFNWLRENGYLMKYGESHNLPTQKSMDLGLMEIKKRTMSNPDGSTRTTSTTKITGKGQIYFINKFIKQA